MLSANFYYTFIFQIIYRNRKYKKSLFLECVTSKLSKYFFKIYLFSLSVSDNDDFMSVQLKWSIYVEETEIEEIIVPL